MKVTFEGTPEEILAEMQDWIQDSTPSVNVIDWDDIDSKYAWVATDQNMFIHAYLDKPYKEVGGSQWLTNIGDRGDYTEINIPKYSSNWGRSLVERP